MKKFCVVLSVVLGLFSVSTFAASPTPAGLSVKITSFSSINSTDHTAEVCGQVSAGSDLSAKTGTLIAVTVISDPNYNPGPYTVLADSSGAFCTVILTQSGTAEALAWVPSTQMKAVSGVANLGTPRK